MDRCDGQIGEYLNTCWRKEKSKSKSIKYVLCNGNMIGMYLFKCTSYHNCTYQCSQNPSTPFESDKVHL